MRYGTRATPGKPQDELDPEPLLWSADGQHPPLQEVDEQPTTASALTARRSAKVQRCSEHGKADPRVEEVDLWPVVVQSGARNTQDNPYAKERLMKYAKDHCSHKVVAWMFKHRDKLDKLIEDAWAWEEVDSFLASAEQTCFQRVLAARDAPCECGGRWAQVVRYSLSVNGIDAASLCYDTLRSLQMGRSENCRVVVLAGRYGGEGKSFFFAPLKAIFGEFLQEHLPGGQVEFRRWRMIARQMV